MRFLVFLTVFVLPAVFGRVFPTGIYQISNGVGLVRQSGINFTVRAKSASDDASATWFIVYLLGAQPDNLYRIQNMKTKQWMNPGSGPGPLDASNDRSFNWSLDRSNPSRIYFPEAGTAVTALPNSSLATAPMSASGAQLWNISNVQPFPDHYRILHAATGTYLFAPAAPGPVEGRDLMILSSAQVWTIAGTGPTSIEGTIVNLHTKAYLGVANGTVGTFSTARPAGAGWRFTIVEGGAILSYVGAPQPNVLTVEPDGRAILDVPRAGDPRQLLAFAPADLEHLS